MACFAGAFVTNPPPPPPPENKIKKKSWGSSCSLRKSSKDKKKQCGGGGGKDMKDGKDIQDLDLYYIKQLAHKFKEFDLEQKIELEIKMREGTTKLLAACKHQNQTLEAAKNLLVSNERMSAYTSELQKRKKEHVKNASSRGRLSVSDLRMPLIWRDIDHFKNKGDYRRFAVFCLVKVGTEIYDTALLCPIDRSLTDITFPDTLVFDDISSDFEMKLQVYSHMLHEDLSMASAPRRIRNTIHSSISRTVGKKLAAALRDEFNSGKMNGPNFELMASASLSLEDVNENIRTHDLKIENIAESRHQLPLYGHFCCRLAAQPHVAQREAYAGYLSVFDGKAKRAGWIRCWAQLMGFQLKLWIRYEHFFKELEPYIRLIINKNTIVNASRSSLELEISDEYEGIYAFKTESAEERGKWLQHLSQQIADSVRWRRAAEKRMEIQTADSPNKNFVKTMRQGSLYDQIPIMDYGSNYCGRYDAEAYSGGGNSRATSTIPSSRRSHSPLRERSHSSSACKPRRLSAWPFTKHSVI